MTPLPEPPPPAGQLSEAALEAMDRARNPEGWATYDASVLRYSEHGQTSAGLSMVAKWKAAQLQAARAAWEEETMNQPNHWHCLDGCEKAQGELRFGGHKLVCARCGAPFVPCTPETCKETTL